MIVKKDLILASQSPRRQALLRQIGLRFDIRESGVDEEYDVLTPPADYVKRLAEKKALAVAASVENAIVIGADTIVVLDDRILGKPRDPSDAAEMLLALSGRTHQVFTGFTLVDRPSNLLTTEFEMTKVKFRALSPDEIREYVQSGSPMDKAGAYGIQDDYGAVFVERVDGCYYNVVGFPLTKFYVTLGQFQELVGA